MKKRILFPPFLGWMFLCVVVIVRLFQELELSDDCESEEDIPGDIEVSIQESDSNEQDDNDNNYAGAAANDDSDDGNQCVGDITEKFTEYFALKGSSYHEDCQKALRDVNSYN